MQRLQLGKADDPVKLRQHTIQIVHDIVAAVIDVAGVQAHTDIVAAHTVHDGLQFLKLAADLTALTGHGLQQHRDRVARRHCLFQSIADLGDTRIHTLSHMAARMEIIVVSRQCRHAAQIIAQHLAGKGSGPGLSGAKIHGVSAMGHQGTKLIFLQSLYGLCAIDGVLFFGLTAPGIAGKKRKGIGTDGFCSFHHGQISVACR